MAAERLCLNVLWVLLARLHLKICHRAWDLLCASTECRTMNQQRSYGGKRQRTSYLIEHAAWRGDVTMFCSFPQDHFESKGKEAWQATLAADLAKGYRDAWRQSHPQRTDIKNRKSVQLLSTLGLVSREGPKPSMHRLMVELSFGIESGTQMSCGCWKTAKTSLTAGSSN